MRSRAAVLAAMFAMAPLGPHGADLVVCGRRSFSSQKKAVKRVYGLPVGRSASHVSGRAFWTQARQHPRRANDVGVPE
jgi:hypothetical protein